jgi:hypothetical protein
MAKMPFLQVISIVKAGLNVNVIIAVTADANFTE